MSDQSQSYPRFSRGQRVQHAILIFSFSVLALTGIPQKYASTRAGEGAIAMLGGIEAVRVVHRAAAILLIVATLYHLFDVGYRVLVRRAPTAMLPRVQDLRDALQTLRYNLGRAAARPRMGRYTFEEKLEYWALIWGTVVMIATGFLLWNPIAAARLLPGQAIPAALAAHGGEALLAVLAVIVWHGYGVHVRHFNRSMFTGSMTAAEMREEHPLELEAILSGNAPPEPDGRTLGRRRRAFLRVAVVLALALAVGLYWFVTFEETALPTVPRRVAAPLSVRIPPAL
ncbi:MAG: formate dehydrogenase subunit gamma [Vicinamibacterales bacterium]